VPVEDLADSLLDRVELHGTDDAAGSLRDAAEEAPLPVGAERVVDDLVARAEGGVAVEQFHRRDVALEGPVVDGGGGDEGDDGSGSPTPVDDGLGHGVGLHFYLEVEVEDLEGVAGTEGDDFGDGVHDGGLGGDVLAVGGSRGVLEINDCDGLGGRVADGQRFVGLH